MDPMDYAFNHPSSSEAPYHIAVTSVSPPWIAYNSGPDEGNGAGPIYLPQTLTLPFPLPQDHLSFAHTYQHHSGQSSNLPWSSGLSHSSAPQDHALSRFRNLSSQSAEEGDQHIERTRGLRSWNSISTRHQLPRLESGTGNVTTLPNSVLRSAESESCSNDQTGIAPRDETLSSPASFFHDTPTFHPDRVLFRGQRWRSHNSNDEEALPDGVLPPLRSQAAFQPNNATPGAALPPLQQDLPSSLNSRQRSETSSRFPTARHSMSDAILPRIEAATNMPVPSSASLHSFTRTERPTSRPHRASRTQALDVQRPISVSLDLGSSSRLPSTGPSPGTSSGVASSSPRRQRPSRTGPRRHMAAPRSPSHAHDRHSIDRSLVREFLDSQDIGPADRIGNYTYPVIEEMMLRNLQALHGSMGHAKVARKSMVKALAHVPVEDLPEDERMCAICYGSYGIESPEGITEEAVQLPGCKHVFGAICLRTWLEDSDKCPYCRKKLPSEPKWFLSAAKRILNLIKRPQNTGCYAADPETCLTVFRGYDRGGASQSPPSMWRQPLDPGEPSSRALNSGRDSAAPGIDAALRNLTPSSDQQLPPSSRADRGHPSPLDR